MKATGILLCVLLFSAAGALAGDDKPNVLLLIADDQGYGDFGFMGNKLVRTPRIDRLAGESAVFKNFVVAPACSPTRAAIWTGRDHLLTGVWGVPPRANLLADETRMPAFFKAAGYRTFHVGKLDCVKAGGGPADFGWEEWLGGGAYEHRDPMLFQTGNNRRGQGWTVDLWTEQAIDFVSRHRAEPWFASVAYIIPHMPWVCDDKYSAPFLAQGCSKDLAACYGSIAHMDECIGRLLDALRETDQERRTIVAFVSDNGQTGPEVKKSSADGFVRGEDWDKRNVARLRGHKATVWENGIRQPFLLRWPEKVAPGERKQFGCAEDILPTLLDLAGVERGVASGQPLTGVSLWPALRRAAETFERPAAFRMAIAGPGAPRNAADPGARKFEDHHLALRGPRFKYHALPSGQRALFDLDADPGETTDVQSRLPEIAARMGQQCRRRWEEVISSGRAFAGPNSAPPQRLAALERSYWLHASLASAGQKGYWGAAFPAVVAPTEAEIGNAARLLAGPYAANRLYLVFHHEIELDDAERVLRAWRRHSPANVQLVPTLLLRMYDKGQTAVFTPDEIRRMAHFFRRTIGVEQAAVYDVGAERDQGAALDELARQFPAGLIRVGLQPAESVRSPFVAGVQDTWSGFCHGKTNADWQSPGFGAELLRRWTLERNATPGLIAWDLIVVAWDYAATPRGAYPGYDDAAKNMPLPAERNRLAAAEILRTARPERLGGFSSDLVILQANSRHPAHDGPAQSFYETLKRGEVYRGYYAEPWWEITAVFQRLKQGRPPLDSP